ncbi:MAG: hypothetical protein GX049_07415 [Alcaligenaceae bacterium]|nr:hypothetical protein [Alcaligenaceae bacterium]
MSWEHPKVTHSRRITLFNQATCSFQQANVDLLMVYTGKSRVFKEYRVDVSIHGDVFSGSCSHGFKSALVHCAKNLESSHLLMSTAGCMEGFSESGLSYNSGYGYLNNSLVHMLCQGTTLASHPFDHPVQPESHEMLFFSYGLDMDASRMTNHVPTARLLGKTALIGFDVFVNVAGTLSLNYKHNSLVYGLLWGIPSESRWLSDHQDNRQELDRTLCLTIQNKPVPSSRSRQTLPDHAFDDLELITYVGKNFEQGHIATSHREKIVNLAQQYGFDPAYIKTLETLH